MVDDVFVISLVKVLNSRGRISWSILDRSTRRDIEVTFASLHMRRQLSTCRQLSCHIITLFTLPVNIAAAMRVVSKIICRLFDGALHRKGSTHGDVQLLNGGHVKRNRLAKYVIGAQWHLYEHSQSLMEQYAIIFRILLLHLAICSVLISQKLC